MNVFVKEMKVHDLAIPTVTFTLSTQAGSGLSRDLKPLCHLTALKLGTAGGAECFAALKKLDLV